MMDGWNLGEGLGNVCWSALDKLNNTSIQFEFHNRKYAVMNMHDYEVTAMIYAMSEYIERHELKREEQTNEMR